MIADPVVEMNVTFRRVGFEVGSGRAYLKCHDFSLAFLWFVVGFVGEYRPTHATRKYCGEKDDNVLRAPPAAT